MVQEILAFVVVVAQGPCSLVESYKDKYGLHQPLRHLPSFPPPLLWHSAFIYNSRVIKSSFSILIKFQIWKIQIFIWSLGEIILTVLLNRKKGLFLGCTIFLQQNIFNIRSPGHINTTILCVLNNFNFLWHI